MRIEMIGASRPTDSSEMPAQPVYTIRVRGHLDRHWSARLAGLAITPQPDGSTLLAGPLPDQSALFGVLLTIRDLNLTLLLVQLVTQ